MTLLTSYLCHGHFHLAIAMQRFLIADLEIKVDSFVCESREFVAKAEFVFPGYFSCPCVAVILLA